MRVWTPHTVLHWFIRRWLVRCDEELMLRNSAYLYWRTVCSLWHSGRKLTEKSPVEAVSSTRVVAIKPTIATATAEKLSLTTATSDAINPAIAVMPRPLDDLVKGYPRIAGRMSLIPETAMFWRFGALNACNLLYLQSELVHVEDRLKELEWQDSTTESGRKQMYALYHYWLVKASVARDGDVRQHELVLKMRKLLQQYSLYIMYWPLRISANFTIKTTPSYNNTRYSECRSRTTMIWETCKASWETRWWVMETH